jgi:hypothetical protein
MKNFIKILIAALVLNVATLSAAEGHGHDDQNAEHEQHEHSNHLSLFAGMTSIFEAKYHAFTVGVDYEYRLPFLNRLLGVGALADFAIGTEFTGVFAGFVGIHPVGGLKILLAPGIEQLFGEISHTSFMVRGSVGYDFMINNFSITPIVSLDYVPEAKVIAFVYGIAAGIGF